MLIPHLNGGIESSQPMSKVRGNNSSGHDDSVPPPPPAHKVNKNHWMIRRISLHQKWIQKKRFIFRKLSWGSKTIENNTNAATNTTTQQQLPSPAESKRRNQKFIFRWFRHLILHLLLKLENSTLFYPNMKCLLLYLLLLNSWSNFGLKDLRNDQVGYYITGAISKHNSF